MDAHLSHTWPAVFRGTISSTALVLMLTPLTAVQAQETHGSSTQPLAVGPDQTIIDLSTRVWAPLTAEGVTPGPEIAVLRGDLKSGGLRRWCVCRRTIPLPTTVIPVMKSMSGSKVILRISRPTAPRRR